MSKIRNSKKAKFFCEFCGNEVKQHDKVCQYCGKFFATERCPNGGKTGRTEGFTHGCLACGYAVHGSRYGTKGKLGLGGRNKSYDGSLPFWIYILVIAVLIALVIGLYSCL